MFFIEHYTICVILEYSKDSICPTLPVPCIGGDKVGMLTHTYRHKSLRKITVTMCKHQPDNQFYVWPDVLPGDLQVKKKSKVIHDTDCPY